MNRVGEGFINGGELWPESSFTAPDLSQTLLDGSLFPDDFDNSNLVSTAASVSAAAISNFDAFSFDPGNFHDAYPPVSFPKPNSKPNKTNEPEKTGSLSTDSSSILSTQPVSEHDSKSSKSHKRSSEEKTLASTPMKAIILRTKQVRKKNKAKERSHLKNHPEVMKAIEQAVRPDNLEIDYKGVYDSNNLAKILSYSSFHNFVYARELELRKHKRQRT